MYMVYIYILYTGNYIHIHAIMDLKVGELWSWHFCFADLFFLSDQNDQRSVSASLSGVQKPDNVIDTSKFDRFRNPKNPNYFCFKIKTWTWTSKVSQNLVHFCSLISLRPWGFPMFSKSQPFRTSVAPAVAAGCQCLWFNNRGAPVGGGKVPQLKRPIWKHCPNFLQKLFFGMLYRCLQ